MYVYKVSDQHGEVLFSSIAKAAQGAHNMAEFDTVYQPIDADKLAEHSRKAFRRTAVHYIEHDLKIEQIYVR